MSEIPDLRKFDEILLRLANSPSSDAYFQAKEDLRDAYRDAIERLSGPAIEAWLTRDGDGSYAAWFRCAPPTFDTKTGWWTGARNADGLRIHESDIRADHHLPKGGGPVRVRLLILPAGDMEKE